MSIVIEGRTVSLFSKEIFVKDNGAVTGGVEIIDLNKVWLTRAKVLASRSEDGGLGFDMTTMYGRRIWTAFNDNSVAPYENNLGKWAELNVKIMRQQFSISSDAMKAADAKSLYTRFVEDQKYWAKRAALEAKMADEDISYDKLLELAGQYISHITTDSGGGISLPVEGAESVRFAQGNSFSASSWCMDWITDLSATVVKESLISST